MYNALPCCTAVARALVRYFLTMPEVDRNPMAERRALVGLHPVDRAGAWYRLAVAQDDAGDTKGALRSIVRSLEDAPNYQLAQELLLKLKGP